MTISKTAISFGLKDENAVPQKSFDVELSDDINSVLREEYVQSDTAGKTLSELRMEQGTLVMLIKRNMKYIIPNGSTILLEGDKLLIIEETK
jgi:cell volume regulation protein A